jgi:hypothetical protein
MGLLFRDAEFDYEVQDEPGLHLEFARQLVYTNLLHNAIRNGTKLTR